MDLPPELWFYTKDGKILKNKQDFLNYIKSCSDDLLNFHKDHFFDWLITAYGDCKSACIVKFTKSNERIRYKLSL
jgi:hypothetical protein